MKLENLLHRLELEAEAKADRNWKQERLELVKRKTAKPPTVTESCRKKVAKLRARTESIYEELYERKLLELEQREHVKATMALIEADRTPAQRAARDREVHDFQERYSALVLEASPSWRTQENLNADFYRQQMSPGRKMKS